MNDAVMKIVPPGKNKVLDELDALAKECSSPNWDGYGAVPVRPETIKDAKRFVEALPLGTRTPSASAEPDGQVTLEWHRSPRRTLSVSVSPDGELHYAALLGASKAWGTEPFFGDVPSSILDLISRVDARGQMRRSRRQSKVTSCLLVSFSMTDGFAPTKL